MTDSRLVLLLHHLEQACLYEIVLRRPVQYQVVSSLLEVPLAFCLELLRPNHIPAVKKTNRLDNALFMRKTWQFPAQFHLSNIMTHKLIIQPQMIHDQNKSHQVLDLIGLKKH